MKALSKLCVAVVVWTVLAPGAGAQLLVDPAGRAAPGGWQAGGGYQDFEANYTVDTVYESLATPDFSRKVYTLYAAYGVLPKLDVFLAAGLSDDLENSDHPAISGDGNVFGAGARGRLWEANGFGVSAYGQVSRMDESFSDERVAHSSIGPNVNERDVEFTALLVGGPLWLWCSEALLLWLQLECIRDWYVHVCLSNSCGC